MILVRLETKREFEYDPPHRFECALTSEQAMKIRQELLDAGRELTRLPS